MKLPRAFYIDHMERDLPTPAAINGTINARRIEVDPADPSLPDLLSDAEYYADPFGPDCSPGLMQSAKATVRAIKGI